MSEPCVAVEPRPAQHVTLRDVDSGTELSCRLCGSGVSRLRVRLEGYSVLECGECGMVFSDLPAASIPSLYEQEYFEREFGPYFDALFGITDDRPLRSHFSDYLDRIECACRPGRLVDVGCASGLFAEVAASRGWLVEGIEVSNHAADEAGRRGIPVQVCDAMEADLDTGAYDAVTLLDVLEHLPDPGALLDRLRPCLADGGVLALSLPNDRNLTSSAALALYRWSGGRVRYPASRVHQIYHVSYFTPRTITALLERHGYAVVSLTPDETVRGLLNEGRIVRAGVGVLFGLSRLLAMQNKMFVVARPR